MWFSIHVYCITLSQPLGPLLAPLKCRQCLCTLCTGGRGNIVLRKWSWDRRKCWCIHELERLCGETGRVFPWVLEDVAAAGDESRLASYRKSIVPYLTKCTKWSWEEDPGWGFSMWKGLSRRIKNNPALAGQYPEEWHQLGTGTQREC